MAGVPEIEVPTEQAAAMPSPTSTAPPLGAYGGMNLGEGLTSIGKEIFGIGWEEYHKAAEAFAQQKESEFQNKALDIRDRYRNLYGQDAFAHHKEMLEEMETTRQQIGDGLQSKYARSLYENNSLRKAFTVRESIDQHFEQQNKQYQINQHKDLQAGDVRLVGKLATDPKYNPKAIEDLIEGINERGAKFAKGFGADAETAKQAGLMDAQKATDALFKILLDKKSHVDPSTTKAELDKYSKKNMVDATQLDRAQGALGGAFVNRYVAQTTAMWDRRSSIRDPNNRDELLKDPEGFIPHSFVSEAIKKLDSSKDPFAHEKAEALTKWWENDVRAFEKNRALLAAVVVGNGEIGDESSLDWQKFQSLHPIEADIMAKKSATWEYTKSRRGALQARELSGHAYGNVRVWLDGLSPDQLAEVDISQVREKMHSYFVGKAGAEDPKDLAKAEEFLKKLKTGKYDSVERRFRSIARDELWDRFKNRIMVEAAMGQAFRFLDDHHKPGENDERELRDALKEAATKKGGLFDSAIFGSVPLLNYKSTKTPGKGAGHKVEPGWYMVAGKKRHWDGTRYDQ